MGSEEISKPSLWLDVAGRRTPVWVHAPERPARAVITSHGLTNDHRDAPLFGDLRRDLLEDGDTVVVEFDYPGSGLADGELKDKRFHILRMALEGVVSHVKREIAPGLPVSIVGRSIGGTVALATAPESRPARMALMSPPFELTRNIASLKGDVDAEGLFPLPYWAAPSGQVKGARSLSDEFFEELEVEERRVRKAAVEVTDTLLVSSTEDPKVESEEMKRLWELLSSRSGNHHMVVESDHNYEAVADSVRSAIKAWICG
jgi:alpha-beta hydrolase superfamily lysophospholipase